MVEEWMVVWQEGGMVAVVGIMFVYLVFSLSKKSEAQQESLESLRIENEGQTRQITEILKEVEESKQIIVRLIDRFNKSDDAYDRWQDKMIDNAERRHESVVKELNDLTDDMNYIKGIVSRLNGKH